MNGFIISKEEKRKRRRRNPISQKLCEIISGKVAATAPNNRIIIRGKEKKSIEREEREEREWRIKPPGMICD